MDIPAGKGGLGDSLIVSAKQQHPAVTSIYSPLPPIAPLLLYAREEIREHVDELHMNLNSLRRGATPSKDVATEADHTAANTGSGKQSTWKRKLVLGTVSLALGMVLRRRLRGRTDASGSSPVESGARSATETSSTSSPGRSIGRRLKMMVISTIVFAVARRVIRRFKGRR
jgi:hypothetical protein